MQSRLEPTTGISFAFTVWIATAQTDSPPHQLLKTATAASHNVSATSDHHPHIPFRMRTSVNKQKVAPASSVAINIPPRESFDDIYLDLSKQPGKCRLAESGLGWKPTGGTTFTLDKSEFQSAQWSRAARGYELKIYARIAGVVQLDGFKQDVRRREHPGRGLDERADIR